MNSHNNDNLLDQQVHDIGIEMYNSKDSEEVYIATSPSFSIVDVDHSADGVYSPDHDSCSNMSDVNKSKGLADSTQEDEPTLSCTLSSTDHLEYSQMNTVDGQNYLSDFSQLNNLGVEASKTFYYVLSPMGTVNSLIRSSDSVDTSQVQKDSQMKSQLQADDDPITPRMDDVIGEKEKEYCFNEPIGLTQAESSTHTHVGGSFDQLNHDYHVTFIHGIPDHIDSPNKDRSQFVWQPLSDEQKKNSEHNQLLMKYDHGSKVELPVIHGQPYLQVALVNEMEATSTSELVATDQILGVTVPELFTCKWEGCGSHFLTNLELIKHVNTTHITSDQVGGVRYTCRWKACVREGKKFDARYKMLIHLRTHTGEKPHPCPVEGCQAAFSRIENMKIHLRTHTGERPYLCGFEGCTKSFANSSDRFKHRRTHSERKPFKCPVKGCEKCYTDPSSLRKHRKRHITDDVKKL